MRVSACMIVKNEERCVERCIRSMLDIVDELLVVDTGSVDKTRQIAQKLGAKIWDFAWKDDFAAAKNEALAHATGDWVLFLDADEWFEGRSAQNLLQFLRALPPGTEAVSVRRVERMNAAEAPVYTPATRAFLNSPDIRYYGAIHEHLLRGGRPLNTVNAPPDKVALEHDGYAGPVGRSKAKRNLQILQRLADGGDDDPMLPYYLGQTLLPLHLYPEAFRRYTDFLERETGASPVALRAMLGCEEALRRMGPAGFSGQEAWRAARGQLARQALERFPLHPTAQLIAGNAQFELGSPADALPHYQKAVALRAGFTEDGGYSETLADQSYPGVYLRIAAALRGEGRLEEAEASCEKALDLAPELSGAAEEYLRCTRNREAQGVAEKLTRWMGRVKSKELFVAAAHAERCDLVFLILYDQCMGKRPPRDVYFTTMQVLVGELETALEDLIARLVHHPLWQGSFEQLPAAERRDAGRCLAELAAASLSAGKVPQLERLLAVAPPALYDALSLCLGREVEVARKAGIGLLPEVSARLLAMNAGNEVLNLWRKVMDLFDV